MRLQLAMLSPSGYVLLSNVVTVSHTPRAMIPLHSTQKGRRSSHLR